MHLFYTPNPRGEQHELDEQESRHAVRVLRLSRGDRVILVDGTGGWYEAEILDDHHKHCLLRILSSREHYRPLPYHLHIAISPTRQMERFEWFLEKATEIGISEITPLICERTERGRLKTDRLEKIIVSAMKQSLRAYKPLLNEPVALESLLARDLSGTRGIAHCMETERVALTDLQRAGSYTLLVGPEGDFTGGEALKAIDAGYRPFHLGESRLRTETAGVHICSAIQIIESTAHEVKVESP